MTEIAANNGVTAHAGDTPAAAPEPVHRGRPIALYLVAFGLAVALPALLFNAYLLYRFEDVSRVSATRVAQDTAASIRDLVDREIAAMVTTLRVLSTSGYLRAGELDAFHDRAADALEGTGNYVILADENGRQLLNTRVPYGSELGPVSDRATVDVALKDDMVYVSDLFYGAVAKRYVFNVAVPVTLETGERRALVMTRNADDPRSDPPPAQAGAGLVGRPDRPPRHRRGVDRRRGNREAGELPRGRTGRRRAACADHLRRQAGRDGACGAAVLRFGLARHGLGAGGGDRGAAVEFAESPARRRPSSCSC